MSSRSYDFVTLTQLGEWGFFGPGAYGYAFVNQAIIGDPLIYSTNNFTQHIPNTATVTSCSVAVNMAAGEYPPNGAATVRLLANDTGVIGAGGLSCPNQDPPFSTSVRSGFSTIGPFPPNATTPLFLSFTRATVDGTADVTANIKAVLRAGDITDALPPTVTINFSLASPGANTGAATNITGTTSQLNGVVNPNGGNSFYPTSYKFQWGITTAYGNETTLVTGQTGSANIPAVSNITGLTGNTLYHYRLVSANDDFTVNGTDVTFTTASADRILMAM